MDLLQDDGASIEEDRISSLTDDFIHRILSFLDMRYAIRTCILSRRWKNTWTSMPYIKLNSCNFKSNRKFAKFVEHVLTHRNNCTEVSEVKLKFDRQTHHMCVEGIMNYANLHNFRKLTIKWCSREEFPYIFSSRTLKSLILEEDPCYSKKRYLPEVAWDFPALETLKLSRIRFDDPINKRSFNLLSKCVNLKDLTLHRVYMHGREIFNVCAPQLLNLTITKSATFPEVFNVVAPRLKNLTASLTPYSCKYRNCGPLFLPLSTDGFNSLEKVNLSFGRGRKERSHGSQLLNLFQIICQAKFLNLDVDIIENLSNSCLDQLSCEPSPFNNLKRLKINAKSLKQNKGIAAIPVQIKNYFLQISPSATFIVDYPQCDPESSAPPSLIDMYKLNHSHEGIFTDVSLAKNHRLMVELRDAQVRSQHPLSEQEIMTSVLGEHHGHVRGVGPIGNTSASSPESRPTERMYTQAEVDAMYATQHSQLQEQLLINQMDTLAIYEAVRRAGININLPSSSQSPQILI